MEDTIAAISTPIGEGGIGIVRINGAKAVEIGARIFNSPSGKDLKEAQTYTMYYGYITDPKTQQTIDEVIVSVMLAPRTFTREDVVEINCHGGIVPLKRVLELVLRQGARLAEPGEFAKRAFLNGRIDLAQAEATIDIIRSKTDASLQLALRQLGGGLSEKTQAIRQEIIFMLAHIEAAIDFPEEDIEEIEYQELKIRARGAWQKTKDLLATADSGKILREGLKTTIIGRPNVGKSSLLNALLKEKRAIVTDIPGTTRDIIEEVVNIRGVPLKIIDTAGIRETEDLVEKIGVERARESLEEADLVLFLLNWGEELQEEDREIITLLNNKKRIIILNKTDLPEKLGEGEIKKIFPEETILKLSLKEGMGLIELEKTIEEMVFAGQAFSLESALVTNIRHKNLLEKAEKSLQETVKALDSGMPTDLISIDLKDVLHYLGEITGETVSDDVIDQIFSQFCIGK